MHALTTRSKCRDPLFAERNERSQSGYDGGREMGVEKVANAQLNEYSELRPQET